MKTIEIGKGVHVPMLTVRDMMEFGDRAWQEERKAIIDDLDASGASPEQRLATLREHSMRRGTAIVLLVGTMRLDIASDIIRRAAFSAKVEADPILESRTPAEIIQTAQRLVGYEMRPEGEPGNG